MKTTTGRFSPREMGLITNLRQVWTWYRESTAHRRLRRQAIREIIREIRKVRAA